MNLDTGSKARVRPVIVTGEITEKRFDPAEGFKELKLEWTGADGEAHARWFKPDELEPVADAPAAA